MCVYVSAGMNVCVVVFSVQAVVCLCGYVNVQLCVCQELLLVFTLINIPLYQSEISNVACMRINNNSSHTMVFKRMRQLSEE